MCVMEDCLLGRGDKGSFFSINPINGKLTNSFFFFYFLFFKYDNRNRGTKVSQKFLHIFFIFLLLKLMFVLFVHFLNSFFPAICFFFSSISPCLFLLLLIFAKRS